MSCRMPHCHRVCPDGSKMKLDHDKPTSPGATFYYCSYHTRYHCIMVEPHRRLPQPVCGDCALGHFQFPKEAAKYPESDIPAITSIDDQYMSTNDSFFGCDDFHGHPFSYQEDRTNSVFDDTTAPTGYEHPIPTAEETFGNFNERVRNGDDTP